MTFITLDDITTATGYPLQVTGGIRIHLQTLIIFRYHTDNELCSAARQWHDDSDGDDNDSSQRRRRRQVTSDTIMPQDLVRTILADEDKLVL